MSSTRELLYNGKPVRFKLDNNAGNAVLAIEGIEYTVTAQELAAGRLLLRTGNGQIPARVAREKDKIWVWLAGRVFEFQQPSSDDSGGAHAAEKPDDLRAPMPGTLVKLFVAAGDAVTEGQIVAVVEAMKMEHPLRAPRAGIIGSVNGTPGSIVDTDLAIVSLAPEEK